MGRRKNKKQHPRKAKRSDSDSSRTRTSQKKVASSAKSKMMREECIGVANTADLPDPTTDVEALSDREKTVYEESSVSLKPESLQRMKELQVARASADSFEHTGDEKFQARDYNAAYEYFHSATNIIADHGDFSKGSGEDKRRLHKLQDKLGMCLFNIAMESETRESAEKCFVIYDALVQKDPTYPLWYKRRAYIRYLRYGGPFEAYKDFVMYAILLGQIGKGIPRQERIDFMLCAHEAAIEKLRLERDNMQDKKPYLTSDWMNLWALCPCDDVLLEDLLSVREELKNPQKKCPLLESAYEIALKHAARGYHSLVAGLLLDGYKNHEGPHRSEAYLWLALIYSQVCGNEVHEYLDTFIELWEVDQHEVSLPRRKQIFMRYMSLARALLKDPFEKLDLSMFTQKEQAAFYMQAALAIILRLEMIEGYEKEDLEIRETNIRKLENIRELCDRAIKADKKCFHAGMLKAYTVMEIEMATKGSKECVWELGQLDDYITSVTRRCKNEQLNFALWCLFSAYFANGRYNYCVSFGRSLDKYLLFPGFIASFLAAQQVVSARSSEAAEIVKLVDKVEKQKVEDPENFRLFLVAAEIYLDLGLLNNGSECANIAIRNWPFHIMTEQIGQLIKNAIVLEAYWDAEHNIKRFQEYGKDEEPNKCDYDGESCEREDDVTDEQEEMLMSMVDDAVEVMSTLQSAGDDEGPMETVDE